MEEQTSQLSNGFPGIGDEGPLGAEPVPEAVEVGAVVETGCVDVAIGEEVGGGGGAFELGL